MRLSIVFCLWRRPLISRKRFIYRGLARGNDRVKRRQVGALQIMSNFEQISFAIEDQVARIKFARPPLNVFDIAMMREINVALSEIIARRDVVAIVFEAAPDTRAFCAGVAIEEHLAETIYQ